MSLSPPHLVSYGRSLFCALALLTPPPATARTPAHAATPRRAQAVEPTKLTPGSTVRREIGGNEAHTYTFDLAEKQFVRVLVSQQGSDVALTIINPDGEGTTVDRPNGSRGREVISHLAKRGGAYRLEVRALERVAPRGFYEVSLVAPRPAVPRDESRPAAERAVTEGERLRARKTAASLPQALEKFGQAIDLWQALDEPYEAAVALYGRCLTHRMLGNNGDAVADCTESELRMRALGDDYGEAAARTGRAWSYIYVGEIGKAYADFNASLTTRRRIGDLTGESLDLQGVGWSQALRGEYEEALDSFQRSLRILEQTGDPRGRNFRISSIGEVYRRTNRPEQAIGYLTRALELERAAGRERGGEAETLTSIGWCHYVLGNLARAQEFFAEALPIRREVGDPTGEAATLFGLAHVERAQTNLYNARVRVEAALAIVEAQRARVAIRPLRLSFFTLAQDYYEFYIDLLMQMHRLDPGRGFAAAALGASERARARSLLDLLGEAGIDVRQGVPAELLERERTLRARLNAGAGYQRQLLSESYTAAQAAAAAKEVDDLSTALGDVETRIRQASPRYAALTQPQPLDTAAIQREVVDADTLLLEYALGRERSFLWAVSPSSVDAFELPGVQEIERAAARARELLTVRAGTGGGQTFPRAEDADARYQEAAARLSRMLLAPAAAQLGTKRLLIVAPGVLQLTAFAALPDPASSAANPVPLVLNHELVTASSASTLAMLRREPPRRESPPKLISILADPVFSRADERFDELRAGRGALAAAAMRLGASRTASSDGAERPAPADSVGPPRLALPRLFRTRWEAEQIAALAPAGEVVQALDFEATREAATGATVGGSRIIHFATHAILDDAHPELSGIALSMFDAEGRSSDGFLRAHDIYNLKLSADLVILSACRTALGRDFRGEGLVGLARGFMYAGSPRVIGSLWETDDKATAELMVRFYRKLLKGGLRPAAALRAAQVEMLRDKRWQPPYFWSGFVLQGEWR